MRVCLQTAYLMVYDKSVTAVLRNSEYKSSEFELHVILHCKKYLALKIWSESKCWEPNIRRWWHHPHFRKSQGRFQQLAFRSYPCTSSRAV